MRVCKSILIATLILIASPVVAQQNMAPQENINDNIRELLRVMNTEKIGDQMLDQIFYAYGQMAPDVPAEVWKKARKEMRTKDFVELVVPIYAKHFDREDIRGLISFYRSTVGKKFIDKQGPILKDSMAAGMAWG